MGPIPQPSNDSDPRSTNAECTDSTDPTDKPLAAAEPSIYQDLNPDQRDFVEFVLSKYVETGVEVLDRELLPELLKLKYEALEDAVRRLGSSDAITSTFTGFQKYLYDVLTI